MPRLFVGIELPEQLRRDLGALELPLPGARWIKPEQLHLTLRFIGQTDDALAARITASLAKVKFPRFSIELIDAGAFPSVRSARVLWIGLRDPAPLRALKPLVDAAIEVEDRDAGRPFHPHLTIARLDKTRAAALRPVLAQLEALHFEPFVVERFLLFSSKLSSKGATYTVEAAYPLE